MVGSGSQERSRQNKGVQPGKQGQKIKGKTPPADAPKSRPTRKRPPDSA